MYDTGRYNQKKNMTHNIFSIHYLSSITNTYHLIVKSMLVTKQQLHTIRLTSSDVVEDGHLLHGDIALSVPLPVNNVSLHAANDHIENWLLHSALLLSRLHFGQLQGNL